MNINLNSDEKCLFFSCQLEFVKVFLSWGIIYLVHFVNREHCSWDPGLNVHNVSYLHKTKWTRKERLICTFKGILVYFIYLWLGFSEVRECLLLLESTFVTEICQDAGKKGFTTHFSFQNILSSPPLSHLSNLHSHRQCGWWLGSYLLNRGQMNFPRGRLLMIIQYQDAKMRIIVCTLLYSVLCLHCPLTFWQHVFLDIFFLFISIPILCDKCDQLMEAQH